MEINGTKLDQDYANTIGTMYDVVQQMDKRLKKIEHKSATSSDAAKTLTSSTQFGNILSEAQVLDDTHHDIIHADTVYVGNNLKIDLINDHPIEKLVKANRELKIHHLQADRIQLNNPKNIKRLFAQYHGNSDQLTSQNRQTTVRQTKFSPNLEELSVDALTVDGFLNDIDLITLERFALKTSGNQTIDANFHVDHLRTNDIHTVHHLNVENIVRTNKGNRFEINQDIQFSAPVSINRLHVNDRINNINIVNGKFDALLKESNETQVILAGKQFENVKLMRPIVLRGKIKSKSLEQINPIVSMSEPIVLEGKPFFISH